MNTKTISENARLMPQSPQAYLWFGSGLAPDLPRIVPGLSPAVGPAVGPEAIQFCFFVMPQIFSSFGVFTPPFDKHLY